MEELHEKIYLNKYAVNLSARILLLNIGMKQEI